MRQASLAQLSALGLLAGATALTGCGVSLNQAVSTGAASGVTGSALMGSVHGGQQPVQGASIQLYAANTAGYGKPSFALLTTAVTTGSGGTFNITGDYTCPSANTPVYITATGGNPGLSSNNGNLAMMAALGPCGQLSSGTSIFINEITTVASVYALAPFMTGPAAVSASASNTQGLANAFAAVNKLVNIGFGTVPGAALPTGATAPTAKLNTLGDILASCINSGGGVAGDGSACGTLFAAATPSGGAAPADTITAALNIAHAPGKNVSALLATVQAASPFQPTVSAAPDFALAIKYQMGGFNAPSAAAVDGSGNLWVTNAAGNSVSVLASTGAPLAGSPYTSGSLNGPSGIAFDASGNAWIPNKGNSTLSVLSASGTGSATPVTGLSAPTAVAIDGLANIWVTNSGNNSVTAITATGTTVNSSTNFSTGGVNTPVALAINPH